MESSQLSNPWPRMPEIRWNILSSSLCHHINSIFLNYFGKFIDFLFDLLNLGDIRVVIPQSCSCCPWCSCRQLMLAGRVWRRHCPSHPLGIILPCHVACRSSLSLSFSSSSVKAVTLTGRICYKSFLMSIQCFHWVLYLCNVYFWISVCKNLRRTLYIMCTTFSIFTPIKEN